MIQKKKFLVILGIIPLVMIALMSQSMESIEAVQSQGTPLPKTGSINSPVCGDRLCSEISNTQIQEKTTTISGYVYKQDFIPVEKIEIDLETTAVFITDPQNDFLSEGGAAWALVGEEVVNDMVVEHQSALKAAAKEVGIPVFYSPHTYTEHEYANWKVLNPIDKIMFSIDMFHEGTWGHEFHPEMIPDENTHVLNPHKGLSNFSSGDAVLQLRQYGIETLVLAGMSANLCVESHLRDAIENGFEVIVIADATAGAGPYSKDAALTNFEFIANEITTTDDIINRLKQAAQS